MPSSSLSGDLELERAIAKEGAEAEKLDPELPKDNAASSGPSLGAPPAHLPWIDVTLAPAGLHQTDAGFVQARNRPPRAATLLMSILVTLDLVTAARRAEFDY